MRGCFRNVDISDDQDVLRDSREKCGCSCVGACQPQTCQCALAGIECQVRKGHRDDKDDDHDDDGAHSCVGTCQPQTGKCALVGIDSQVSHCDGDEYNQNSELCCCLPTSISLASSVSFLTMEMMT